MKKELTFWQLISDCCEKDNLTQEPVSCKIVIPTLQRDYAQGRKDKAELRARFLKSLKYTLDGNEVKHLDFVYGNIKSFNSKNEIEFIPLDGQQRLTTLWMIHVYIALMAIKLNSPRTNNYKYANEYLDKLLCHFTYKTRTSSVDYINELIKLKTSIKSFKYEKETLSQFIQKQTWFFQGWKQDPTVQSMLRMLSGGETEKITDNSHEEKEDCIEKVFGNSKEYINKIFGKLFWNCNIKFFTLDLNDINQSDDLYIKMNARGEQLSSFENFKADLVEYLQREGKPKKFVTIGENAYILTKWDVDWTDLFWTTQRLIHPLKVGSNNPQLNNKDNVDDVFFVFLKRYLLNDYTANWNNGGDGKKRFKNDLLVQYFQQYENNRYTSFSIYEKILSRGEEDILEKLAAVLDGLCNIKRAVNGDINKMMQDEVPLLKDFCMLPTYQSATDEYSSTNTKVRGITLQQRVLFYGICQFLIRNKNSSADIEYLTRFKHWLRLVANLTFYSEIENLEAFRIRILCVKSLIEKLTMTQDLYHNALYIKLNPKLKDFHIQWEQEKKKILLINSSKGSDYETIMKKFEGLWIFRGHIACLLSSGCITEENYNKLYSTIGNKYSHPKDDKKMRAFFTALLFNLDVNVLKNGKEILLNNAHGHMRQQLNGEILMPALINVLRNQSSIVEQAANTIKYYFWVTDWRKSFFIDYDEIWKKTKSCKIRMKDNTVYLFYGMRKSSIDTILPIP